MIPIINHRDKKLHLLHPSRVDKSLLLKGYYGVIIRILKELNLLEPLIYAMLSSSYAGRVTNNLELGYYFLSWLMNSNKKMPLRFSEQCKRNLKAKGIFYDIQRFDVLRRALFEYYISCATPNPIRYKDNYREKITEVFDNYPIPKLIEDIKEQGITYVICKFLPNYQTIAKNQDEKLQN